ncbi:MAG: hypothetical protein JSU92_06270 [Deltaproteobacteria bacterium]|nr:MAG: hypothetical protein JSU92_06270 [Deltaproteobacteria bacterium]
MGIEKLIDKISIILLGTFLLLTAAGYLINRYNLVQRAYNSRFLKIVWIIVNAAGFILGSVVLYKELWFGLLILSVVAASVWLFKSGGNLPWLTATIKVGIIFIIVILIYLHYSQLGFFKKMKFLLFH